MIEEDFKKIFRDMDGIVDYKVIYIEAFEIKNDQGYWK